MGRGVEIGICGGWRVGGKIEKPERKKQSEFFEKSGNSGGHQHFSWECEGFGVEVLVRMGVCV